MKTLRTDAYPEIVNSILTKTKNTLNKKISFCCGFSSVNPTPHEIETERRLDICYDCNEYRQVDLPVFDHSFGYCAVCYCPLATRVHTKCPIGKW